MQIEIENAKPYNKKCFNTPQRSRQITFSTKCSSGENCVNVWTTLDGIQSYALLPKQHYFNITSSNLKATRAVLGPVYTVRKSVFLVSRRTTLTAYNCQLVKINQRYARMLTILRNVEWP